MSMDPGDLERLVDRELRRLPTPSAPRTLLPRVLAATQAWARRPWYGRAWLTWPLGWQVVSVAALVSLIAGSAVLLPSMWASAVVAASPIMAGPVSDAANLAQRAGVAANAFQVVWRAVLEPLVTYAFVLVALMCLACAAFGAALNHVAFERAVLR